MSDFPVTFDSAGGPVVQLVLAPDGTPQSAVAGVRLDATPEQIWALVADLPSYATRVPMVNYCRREGDRVTMGLKFKISLFSAKFEFVADAKYEAGKWLELTWVEGEPRDLRLRFDLYPGARAGETFLYLDARFDVASLGWLVKFFLKHHPEINYGIFPGTALVLIDSIRQALGKPIR